MATLNRAQLGVQTYSNDYATTPVLWAKEGGSPLDPGVRPAGWDARTCYDFNEGTALGRGLDLNVAGGVWGTGEKTIASDAGYLAGAVGNPFTFNGSTCLITASPATPAAVAAVQATPGAGPPTGPNKTPSHVSGVLNLAGRVIQRYGYFEVRCSEATAEASWSGAYLMNPNGSPHCEIDIFERIGGPGGNASVQSGKLYQTATTRYDKWGALRANGAELSSQSIITGAAVAPGVKHNYGLLWRRDLLVWYVDDIETKRVTNDGWDQALGLIVDLAGGGNWPEGNLGLHLDPASTFSMDIDWIKTWQLA